MEQVTIHSESTPEELSDYAPTYIKHTIKDYRSIEDAYEKEAYQEISNICHRILGTAISFGFFHLDKLIKDLQSQSHSCDKKSMQKTIKLLKHYLGLNESKNLAP